MTALTIAKIVKEHAKPPNLHYQILDGFCVCVKSLTKKKIK